MYNPLTRIPIFLPKNVNDYCDYGAVTEELLTHLGVVFVVCLVEIVCCCDVSTRIERV